MYLTIGNLEVIDPLYLPASPCSNHMLAQTLISLPSESDSDQDMATVEDLDLTINASQQRIFPEDKCFLTTFMYFHSTDAS